MVSRITFGTGHRTTGPSSTDVQARANVCHYSGDGHVPRDEFHRNTLQMPQMWASGRRRDAPPTLNGRRGGTGTQTLRRPCAP